METIIKNYSIYNILKWVIIITSLTLGSASNANTNFEFNSIDGGEINLTDFLGKPLLVVNTASRCGFTNQYEGLQKLYEKYSEEGLVVIAIPSNDFNQELKTEDSVKEFCSTNFGLTFPMTTITQIRGANAHPFYKWLEKDHKYKPVWNFNKLLFNSKGELVASYGSFVKPTSRKITTQIDALFKE